MLGTDFPYRQFYPRGAGYASRRLMCGPSRSAAARGRYRRGGRRSRDSLKVCCRSFKKSADRTHLDRATEHYRKARKDLDGLAVSKPGRQPIHPSKVAKAISDHASQDAIFTCDVVCPRCGRLAISP